MQKPHVCQIEVRGYELDSFGHVNHAQYVHYLEHARWKMLEDAEIGLPQFKQWEAWPIIAEINIKYLKPTFMGNILRVESDQVETGKSQFVIEQKIFRNDEPVLNARVRIVMVDATGRPCEIPAKIKETWPAPAPVKKKDQ